MGALLNGIKRRLLGARRGDAGQGAAEEPAAADGGALPRQAPLPSQWPAGLRRGGSTGSSPGAAALDLASPRRIALGALPAALAALQQQFAALPQHQSPSKEQLQTRLAASRPAPPQPAGKAGSRLGARGSPRRLPKGVKRSAAKVHLRKQPSGSRTGLAAAAAPVAEAAANTPPEDPQLTAQSSETGQGPPSFKPSKLALLKQRQARRSADGQTGGDSDAPAAMLQQEGSTLQAGTRTQSSEAEVLSAPPSSRLLLGARLTPRVLAAAAKRAERAPAIPATSEQLANGSEVSRRTTASGTGSRRPSSGNSSNGDLGITLLRWAGKEEGSGPASLLPTLWPASNDVLLPCLNYQPQHSSSQQQPPQPRQATPPAARPGVLPASMPTAAYQPGKDPQRLQRLSRSDLPADLLSLRDSVSLARQPAQAANSPLPTRRARSVQEAQATAEQGSGALVGLPPRPRSSVVLRPAAEAGAEAQGSNDAAAQAGDKSKQLAALLQQPRPGWVLEDPPSVSTGVVEPAHQQFHARLGAPKDFLPAAEAVRPDAYELSAASSPECPPHPVHQHAALQPRQRGMTQAQLRQQQAWGSLAGTTLEEMLKRPPRLQPPPDARMEAAEAADRENSAVDLNNASPNSKGTSPMATLLQAAGSPKRVQQQQAQRQWLGHQSPDAGGAGGSARQGRRRTQPPPSFVESLERLAALHRACSDSEQQEGGIQWQLPPALRRSRSPERQQAGRLPPLHQQHSSAGPAAELHWLGVRAAGHLANARRRGSWQHAAPLADLQAAAPVEHLPSGAQPANAQAPPTLPPQPSTSQSIPAACKEADRPQQLQPDKLAAGGSEQQGQHIQQPAASGRKQQDHAAAGQHMHATSDAAAKAATDDNLQSRWRHAVSDQPAQPQVQPLEPSPPQQPQQQKLPPLPSQPLMQLAQARQAQALQHLRRPGESSPAARQPLHSGAASPEAQVGWPSARQQVHSPAQPRPVAVAQQSPARLPSHHPLVATQQAAAAARQASPQPSAIWHHQQQLRQAQYAAYYVQQQPQQAQAAYQQQQQHTQQTKQAQAAYLQQQQQQLAAWQYQQRQAQLAMQLAAQHHSQQAGSQQAPSGRRRWQVPPQGPQQHQQQQNQQAQHPQQHPQQRVHQGAGMVSSTATQQGPQGGAGSTGWAVPAQHQHAVYGQAFAAGGSQPGMGAYSPPYAGGWQQQQPMQHQYSATAYQYGGNYQQQAFGGLPPLGIQQQGRY